ncbi:MAG TPA: hypothetical protein ENN13_04040, partial [Candidatus Altiarchaeales archaeon]|nr:hypothetical protein [Candidatus Altiarchaeales archaeon]
ELKSSFRSVSSVLGEHTLKEKSLSGERDRLSESMRQVVSELDKKSVVVGELDSRYKADFGEFKKLEQEHHESQESVDSLKSLLESKRIELESSKAELNALQSSQGQAKDAVIALSKLKNVLPGIYGPVFQLGSVKSGEYELALQISAGPRMQYVVVDTVDTAGKAIKYLREKKIGRATFIPLDQIRADVSRKKPDVAISFARDLIECKREFKKVFDFIFGDTVIVKDLEDAKKIGFGEFRQVTLDGDLLEKSGSMTGGFLAGRPVFGFADLERLEARINGLDGEKSRLSGSLTEAVQKLSEVERRLRSSRNSMQERQSALKEAQTQQSILAERKNNLKSRISEIEGELNSLRAGVEKEKIESTELEKRIRSVEKSVEKVAASYSLGGADVLEGLRNEVKGFEVEVARISENMRHLNSEIAENNRFLEDLVLRRNGLEKSLSEAKSNINVLEKDLEKLVLENESLDEKLKKLRSERDGLEQSLTDTSGEKGSINAKLYEIAERLNGFAVEEARIVTRLEDLEREYGRFEGVGLLEDSIKALTENLERLEQKIAGYGSVNMRAIETYDTVKSEYEDLMKKLETLQAERASIYDFMDKIEQKKTKTFMDTFNVVKANFERIFAKLSDGSGTLILDKPTNVSESGLDIKASPKGKRIMSLDAMSGGEKTLTSAAFLLAVQQYKPSHFYILDEMDAALDRANSRRLAEMLSQSQTQFIMVTHNNEMMRYMDSAIGVTMVEGISHIVGVEIPKLEAS